MTLHPNPPRLVTVGLAVALGAIGFVYAWPLDGLIPVLQPVADLAAGLGLTPDRELGYLAMFSSACLLVAGSLLPGI
ncbi:MAG: hypothetical protein A2V85_02215 [Chloroflexi bacterium RBG_16_72_14]|nr:MAG: hypothetical protein A2V85_02215 [Chloroflexi bacterium RBG_16_72_14]